MRFLTIKQAAEEFFGGAVSERVLYRLFEKGVLKGTKVGGKILLYQEELESYLKAQENGPPEPPPPKRAKPKRQVDGGFEFFKLPK